MKKFFISSVFLSLLLLTACSPVSIESVSYRWEMYDVGFTYPEELTIYEDKQILFNDDIFDVVIMAKGDLTNNASAGLEIEVMARMKTSLDAMLERFNASMDYEDLGTVRIGKNDFRKICYELFGSPRCSYLIEKNGNYYQFNLDDEYRDEFLRSVAFVE